MSTRKVEDLAGLVADSDKPTSSVSALTFFSDESYPEVQKLILSNIPSHSLIKLITTSKLFQALITEILFEREDVFSLKFQENTLEKWYGQIRQECSVLGYIFGNQKELDRWIARIKKCLLKTNSGLTYKLHCIKLLQYLNADMPDKNDDNLCDTISRIQGFSMPSAGDTQLDTMISAAMEEKRNDFLGALRPVFISEEMINIVLNNCENPNESNSAYHHNCLRLAKMASHFSTSQLIKAVTVLFNKTVENYCYNPNTALEALIEILNKRNDLPFEVIKRVFIDAINNFDRVRCQDKDLADFCSFRALLILSSSNKKPILDYVVQAIDSRINHPDIKIRASSYEWVKEIANYLEDIPERLITGTINSLIADPDSYLNRGLTSIASKLSLDQLTKYIFQYLPLLDSKENDKKILGCVLIGAFAAHLSPCPEDIIQKLMVLAEDKVGSVRHRAIAALRLLKPNMLFIKTGLIIKMFIDNSGGYDYTFPFQCLIALSSSISTEDISDELIQELVRSRPCDAEDIELKRKALALLCQKMSESQLDLYVRYSLQLDSYCEFRDTPSCHSMCRALESIPNPYLWSRFDAVDTRFRSLLQDKDWLTRSRACETLSVCSPLLSNFSDDFLWEFVKMISDKDYRVRDKFCTALFKVLPHIKGERIDSLCEIFLLNIPRGDADCLLQTLEERICEYFGLLAEKLSMIQLVKVVEILKIKLDAKNWNTSLMAFNSLAQMANRFSGEYLDSLFTLLASKADQHTFKYFRNIVHLITPGAQKAALDAVFRALESDSSEMRYEACLTLSKLAKFISRDQVQTIISKFLLILRNEESDLIENILESAMNGGEIHCNRDQTAALDGLIMLAEFIEDDQLNEILALPERSFDIIAAKYILTTHFNLTHSQSHILRR